MVGNGLLKWDLLLRSGSQNECELFGVAVPQPVTMHVHRARVTWPTPTNQETLVEKYIDVNLASF